MFYLGSSTTFSYIAELLNLRNHGSLIKYLTSKNGDSEIVKPSKMGGVCPSQKVIMQTKFSATSLPKSFKTSVKIYFYDAVSLAFED